VNDAVNETDPDTLPVSRTAIQEKKKIPSGFPRTSPSMMPAVAIAT